MLSHTPWGLALLLVGITLFVLFVLGTRMGALLRFLGRLLLGVMLLSLSNVFGGPLHFFIGLNPVSVLLVGLLGVPGLLLLGGLHFLALHS